MVLEKWFYRLLCQSWNLRWWFRRWLPHQGMVICLFIALTAGLDTRQTLAYQIASWLMALMVVAIAGSRFVKIRVTVERKMPRFGSVGTPLNYRVVIHNPSDTLQTGLQLFENIENPNPSLREFRDHLSGFPRRGLRRIITATQQWFWLLDRRQLAKIEAIAIPTIPPRSQTEITLTLTPKYRGSLHLTGYTLTAADPLGLVNRLKTKKLPQSFWILPKQYKVPPISLPGSRRYQSGGVAFASSVGDSEEFRALREYRAGDPLRKIHWKSWAKTGKPIVKEDQDEFFVRHALILDTFLDTDYSEKLEEAIAVAASFACEFQTQEALLDLMFVGAESYCFTAGRGVGNTDQMLEILASVQPCRDKQFEFLTPVVMERSSMLSGCICIFLEWDKPRKKLIQYLQKIRIPLMVYVLCDRPLMVAPEEQIFQPLQLGQIQKDLLPFQD